MSFGYYQKLKPISNITKKQKQKTSSGSKFLVLFFFNPPKGEKKSNKSLETDHSFTLREVETLQISLKSRYDLWILQVCSLRSAREGVPDLSGFLFFYHFEQRLYGSSASALSLYWSSLYSGSPGPEDPPNLWFFHLPFIILLFSNIPHQSGCTHTCTSTSITILLGHKEEIY